MSTIQVINAKHPSSASNNLVLDNAGNATFAGTAAMASSFLRNRIINGGMQVWQRGTSFSGNVYTADRWIAGNNPSSVVQSSDAPAGHSLSLDITGANHLINQRIEAASAFDLASTPVVVSFWAKSISGTNTLTVQIGTPSAVDNFAIQNVQQTSSAITLSSSWAYYTVAFSALPASASNGVFIYIFRNGSTATDRTRITGVQLEVGSAATPFERRQYGQELALCQRYYEVTDTTLTNIFQATGATAIRVIERFQVVKRAAPTVTYIGGSASVTIPSSSVYGAAINRAADAIYTGVTAAAEL